MDFEVNIVRGIYWPQSNRFQTRGEMGVMKLGNTYVVNTIVTR